MRTINILIIGADITSNGGIASVIKCYYKEFPKVYDYFNLFLIKTNFYKDKESVYEIPIFIYSFLKACIYLIYKKIDIVHIHSSSGYSFYRKSFFVFLSKLFRKKLIVHLHSSNFYEFFICQNRLLKAYIGLILKSAHLVITLCKDWTIKLSTHYPNVKIKTIHNPIEIIQEYTPSKKSTDLELKILFLGFLIKSKGILDLLHIAKMVSKLDDIKVKFIIAGKGDLESTIKNYIQQNKLSDIIKYKGWVSGKKKEKLLKNSDIFFLPSYKEGMPISILEAMSYSLPIISTNISGIPDLVEHGKNGLLYMPGDIDNFYRSILLLYRNTYLRHLFGKNSYERTYLFSSKAIIIQLADIYKKLKKA